MPCGVTADLIEVLDNDTVRISGSFDNVQSFSVRIVGLTDLKSATLAGTTWSIEYSEPEITGDLTEFRETFCDREAEYAVRRPLFGNSELGPCQGTATVRVQCDTPPVGCPDVSVTVGPGGCINDDTERLMTFFVTVPDGATIEYMWTF